MPPRPLQPCAFGPACSALVRRDSSNRGRCPAHQVVPWAGRGSRQERGLGAEYERGRRVAMARDRECQGCGRPAGPGDSCDHRIARAFGGTNDPANLRRLCAGCTRIKDAADAAAGRRRA